MSVWARSDVASVAIPVTSGGCGESHSRPVVQGAPAKIWKLTCGPCETVIKRDIRASTIEWTDKEHIKHEHNTATWGDDPTRIPLTPDEERVSQSMEKEGKASMAQAFQGMAQALISEQRKAAAADTDEAVQAEEALKAVDRVTVLEAELQSLRDLINGRNAGPEHEPAVIAAPACPECGGPLRKPGSRGPTPKVCTECKASRRKVKASA